MKPARVLVVAGHDSSGGAGVDADREAILAFGAEVECVITAWTTQDEQRFGELGAVRASEWLSVGLNLLERSPAILKFGLLPGADALAAARVLALRARELQGPGTPWVLDPVVASSTGREFLCAADREWLRLELLPLGPILTPNRPEAELLADLPGEPERAARALLDAGCSAVVLKGGHAGGGTARDLLFRAGEPEFACERPRVAGRGLHGSGCRFASALAAGLARGDALPDAVQAAGDYVARRIAAEAQ